MATIVSVMRRNARYRDSSPILTRYFCSRRPIRGFTRAAARVASVTAAQHAIVAFTADIASHGRTEDIRLRAGHAPFPRSKTAIERACTDAASANEEGVAAAQTPRRGSAICPCRSLFAAAADVQMPTRRDDAAPDFGAYHTASPLRLCCAKSKTCHFSSLPADFLMTRL